jgi:hypothetical protein
LLSSSDSTKIDERRRTKKRSGKDSIFVAGIALFHSEQSKQSNCFIHILAQSKELCIKG